MTTLRTMTGPLPEGPIVELDRAFDDVSLVSYVSAMWRLLRDREAQKIQRWTEKNPSTVQALLQPHHGEVYVDAVFELERQLTKLLAPTKLHQLSFRRGELGFYTWAESASERASEPTELPEDSEWNDDFNSVTCPMD